MFVGAKLEDMAVLSGSFGTEAEQVEMLQGRVQSILDNTEWTGLVADEFRSRWNTEFVGALVALRDALSEASTVVEQRRAAIDQATNVFAG